MGGITPIYTENTKNNKEYNQRTIKKQFTCEYIN